MQNFAYIEKGILSASIKTLLIKLLSSFCTSSIEPLGSKVPLLLNVLYHCQKMKPAVGTMVEPLHT